MEKRAARYHRLSVFLVLLAVLMVPLMAWAGSGDRQIASGPYSFTVRGGGVNDSMALGVDGRVDYLTELLNLHLFGTFDWLNTSRGEGEIDNKRYGAGLALSRTFARQANVFAGSSWSREMGENYGHIYLGGKLKVADFALLSASYGFGLGPERDVRQPNSLTTYLATEAVDWFKAGTVLVSGEGLKANVYYYMTDPGNQQISGIEGELSYPVFDNVTIGVNGGCDLTKKTNQERNWRTFAFVTYAFGSQKGSPIEVALEKNNPVEYARITRFVRAVPLVQQPGNPPPAILPLIVAPSTSNATGCSTTHVQLTASGGSGSYTWTTSEGGQTNLSGATGPTVTWFDSSDNFCGPSGTVTITVHDSLGATAAATIHVISAPS